MRQHTYGYIYAILAASLYAFVTIIGKTLVTGGVHPLQIAFYQYFFTVIILGTWLFFRTAGGLRRNVKTLGAFALLGIIGGAGTNLLYYSALQYLDAGLCAMLLFFHPVYITIFFAVTKIKKLKPINYFSVLLAITGAAVVLDIFNSSFSLSVAGLSFGILSGVSYAFYNIFADLKFKEENPNVINFYACLAAFMFSTGLLTFSGIGFSLPLTSVPSIFLLACLSGIVPPYFFFKALQYIGSEKVSVISSIELPVTLFLAFTILNEYLRPIQLFGVVLIILSSVLLHRNESKLAGEIEKKTA